MVLMNTFEWKMQYATQKKNIIRILCCKSSHVTVRTAVSFVSATELAVSSLQSASFRNAGMRVQQKPESVGSEPYQGTCTRSLSFSLSLSLFRACSCVWPVAGPRDEAGRTGTSEEWERREGLTEARQALYERGGHRGPLPSPLMFNSCVWALAGRRRRRRSVREECEDA